MLKSYLDMSRAQLQDLTEKVDQECFSAPFHYHGHVVFNRRFKTTGADYNIHTDEIRFNPKQLTLGHDDIVGILKHELCHFYIHHLIPDAKPHGPEFKSLLRTVGGLRYAHHPKEKVVYRYFYKCKDCGFVFGLTIPLMLEASYHGTCLRCHGDIEVMEKHEPYVNYENSHNDFKAIIMN